MNYRTVNNTVRYFIQNKQKSYKNQKKVLVDKRGKAWYNNKAVERESGKGKVTEVKRS